MPQERGFRHQGATGDQVIHASCSEHKKIKSQATSGTGIDVSMPDFALAMIAEHGPQKAAALSGVQCGQNAQLLQ
jgi:hypothetical protein